MQNAQHLQAETMTKGVILGLWIRGAANQLILYTVKRLVTSGLKIGYKALH